MSAKISKPPTAVAGNAQQQVHHFNQSVPIPSYLIAIVAGDLVSHKLGPRSHVWSERGLINRSAWEFEQVDMILKTAESIAGPYVFEVYDLLILPPSFPFGGMENPCLTFVTPTLLAGDRSLVYGELLVTVITVQTFNYCLIFSCRSRNCPFLDGQPGDQCQL